ncbi:MAG: hypothetical protein ABJO01_10760 [Parasphingorhabdus sp.]|uniref:hypothetical protein n=1 Tax=Parasphingorhabdus sp. TaxID=2709688 RepID=UPI003297B6E9
MRNKTLLWTIAVFFGLPILCVLIFAGSLLIGDHIASRPISVIHAQIKPGMTRDMVIGIMKQDPEIVDLGGETIMQLTHYSENFTSPLVGSWSCMAKIHFTENRVRKVGEIFCVD